MRRRHNCRRAVRSSLRCPTRVALRTRWRAPDDLGDALTAFRRALAAQRRLARLAPRFFDSVVIERERREREDRRRWMALWEPALTRAYGCDPLPPKPEEDLPPLPPPPTQRAVERHVACWDLWFNLGREALRRHQQRRPHELIGFSRLARLIQLASDLGRLACGVDSGFAAAQPSIHDAALADLERAYGQPCNPASPGQGSPPPLAAQESNPASNVASAQLLVASSSAEMPPANDNVRSPPADLAPGPAAPFPQAHYRCDAWSRWARQMRRRGGNA